MSLNRRVGAACAGLLVALFGCQPSKTASGSPPASPSASARATPATLIACPPAPAAPASEALKSGLPAPDDLAFLPDGRLLFSDIHTGNVSALNTDGSVVTIAGGLSAPEGMVMAADGRLLVAEQGRNRVMAVDLSSHAVSLWRAFPNRTGRDGLDGIGPSLRNGDVIVPDSPNGVVWRVSADGKTATRIGIGMTRPVGAAVDAQGRIFVADEGGSLWVLDSGQRRFAALQTPDDVLVARDGHLFVNTLGDNAIRELDASAHTVSVIHGIRGPQGIGLDAADNLYYTEFDAGRIIRVVRTFILEKASVSRTSRGTVVLCAGLRRAAGFAAPLMITASSTSASTVLQLEQPAAGSSGGLEVSSSEALLTFSIGNGALELSETASIP